MRRGQGRRGVVGAVLVALMLPASAAALPSDPDPGFAGDGSISFNIGRHIGNAEFVDVTAAAGSYVAAVNGHAADGDLTLVKVDRSGDLDPAFGDGGLAEFDLGLVERATTVVGLSDGDLAMAGSSCTILGDCRLVVARLNSSGSPDTSFGSGGAASFDTSDDAAEMVALATGELLVVDRGCEILKLNATGGLVSAFSGDGRVELSDVPSDISHCSDIAATPDGGVAVTGSPSQFGEHADEVAVQRLTAAGAPQSGFGTGGRVTLDKEKLTGSGVAQSVQPQVEFGPGNTVYVGGGPAFAIARLTAAGDPDTTFSGDGYASVTIFGSNALADLVVRPDGRPIAVGATSTAINNRYVGAVQLTTAGEPDDSFGTEGTYAAKATGSNWTDITTPYLPYGGAATLNGDELAMVGKDNFEVGFISLLDAEGDPVAGFGDGAPTPVPFIIPSADTVYASAMTADGRIVTAGQTMVDPPRPHGGRNIFVTRTLPGGGVDTSFGGGDGIAVVEAPSASDAVRSVAVQPDGRILIGGNFNFTGGVMRVDETGVLDTDFGGGDGLAGTGPASDVYDVEFANGQIFLAGVGGCDFVVGRLTAAGVGDSGFSGDGFAKTDFGGDCDVAYSLVPLPGGGMTAAGRGNGTFSIAQYEADGDPDASFGTGGKTVITAPTGTSIARVLVRQADGRLLVLGQSAVQGVNASIAIVRLTAAGTIDESFGESGLFQEKTRGFRQPIGLVVQSDGGLVAAALDAGGTRVLRVTKRGLLDPRFDGDDGVIHLTYGGLLGRPVGIHQQESGRLIVAATAAEDPTRDEDEDVALAALAGGVPVDDGPPAVSITSGPSGPTSAAPRFTFTANELGVKFECRLDSGVFKPCNSPHSPAPVSKGAHTFELRGMDVDGNYSPPVTRAFSMVDPPPPADKTAPNTFITKKPPTRVVVRKAQTKVTFAFRSTEARSSFRCKLDKQPFKPCASPKSYRLKPGRHVFLVRATDRAGNTDRSPAKFVVTVIRRR